MACPKCHQADTLLIEVSGILDGDESGRVSTATVMMSDDGFDSPLFVGHPEWTGPCACPEGKFEGEIANFTS